METIKDTKKNNLGVGIIIFCVLTIISSILSVFTFGHLSPSFEAVGISIPPFVAYFESTLTILSGIGSALILFKNPIGVYIFFISIILIILVRFIFLGFNTYVVFGNVLAGLFYLLFAYFIYRKRDLFWN